MIKIFVRKQMDLDREDASSLKGGASDVTSEAAGAVILAESSLTVPDENKNGESNSSSESGLEVDRGSVGNGSRGSEGEREFDPAEMVRRVYQKTLLSTSKSIAIVFRGA